MERITFDEKATSGTWRITVNGAYSNPIRFDATQEELDAAVEQAWIRAEVAARIKEHADT
jgi:hypothetical protein